MLIGPRPIFVPSGISSRPATWATIHLYKQWPTTKHLASDNHTVRPAMPLTQLQLP